MMGMRLPRLQPSLSLATWHHHPTASDMHTLLPPVLLARLAALLLLLQYQYPARRQLQPLRM